MSDGRISISEAAVMLDRSPHTLRSWDRNGSMPRHLRPKRDEHGNRYWTPQLIEDIKAWIEETGFFPGRAIDYAPDADQLQRHIARIRKAKKSVNGHAHGEALKDMITEAIKVHNVAPAKVVEQLPQVVATLNERGETISLDQALTVAASVIQDIAPSS